MKLIPAGTTRSIGRLVLKSKKNSPHIFFALGVAGAVGSTVLACRATLKLEETLDEIQEDIDEIQEDVEDITEEAEQEEMEEDERKRKQAVTLEQLTSDVRRVLADLEALKKKG